MSCGVTVPALVGISIGWLCVPDLNSLPWDRDAASKSCPAALQVCVCRVQGRAVSA